MKQIEYNFSFHNARNSQHYELHYQVLQSITAEFAQAQSIGDLYNAYSNAFAIETGIYRTGTAFQETEEIAQLDTARDRRFLYISHTVMAAEYSADERIVAAGKKLSFFVNMFKDSYRMEYSANTGEMRDFIEKMRLPENEEAVETLNLGQAIDDLETANNQFSTVFVQRKREYLARVSTETMKTIRPQVDKLAKELFAAINALYQVNELVTKDAEKRTALEAVIDEVNMHLVWLERTLDGSGTGSNDNAPSDGDDTNTDDPTPPPYEPEEDEPVVQ